MRACGEIIPHCGIRIWASGRPGPGRICCARFARSALGLSKLGIKRGDTIAIAGNNRPRLYGSILAAQALGAIPVPVYADAVATEMAYVLDHADVAVAVVQDQEQVDKILSVQEQLPKLRHIVYDETRGLRDYDHSRLHSLGQLIAEQEAIMAGDPDAVDPRSIARSRPAARPIRRSFSIPPAPPAAPRAWCCRRAAASPRRRIR